MYTPGTLLRRGSEKVYHTLRVRGRGLPIVFIFVLYDTELLVAAEPCADPTVYPTRALEIELISRLQFGAARHPPEIERICAEGVDRELRHTRVQNVGRSKKFLPACFSALTTPVEGAPR